MNDFTKEELQQVIKWATTDIDLNPSKLEVSLFERIVAMIDSYCEHTPEPSPEICCTKCQRTLI
jgi:hypothetical protein